MWTPLNWLGLSQPVLLMNKLNNFEVFSSSRSFPCHWRARTRKRHRLLLYGCLLFSLNVRQLIVPFLNGSLGKTAFLHPKGTSLRRAAKTVKFVNFSNFHFVFILSRLEDFWRQFCWENLSILPSRLGCTQARIDPAGYCFRQRKSIWILHFLYYSKLIQKPDSLSMHISDYWKNDQVSRSRLIGWEFPLRNWILCGSLFQVPNPPRNVDQNATLLSICDLQHLPLHVPHPRLLFLIRSATRVECFYIDVKRKILESLESKIYTWRWYQVLGRYAS